MSGEGLASEESPCRCGHGAGWHDEDGCHMRSVSHVAGGVVGVVHCDCKRYEAGLRERGES